MPPLKDFPSLQNLFGVEVAAFDVASFLSAAHHLYPLLAAAWLLLVWRRRSSAWLLAGVLLANLFAWFVTTYPLPRLYALGVGRDRLSNLAFCQVAAATGSPLATWQVGQTHLDRQGRPHHVLWGLLVAGLSGWEPRRVPVVYAWLPLAMLWGLALALALALRPPRPPPPESPEAWSGWERALVAGGATLLCAAPLDFTSPYGPAWSMMFLLKPNHALGLVVFPLVLRSCARSRGLRGWLWSALLLHLLGWAFALHVVYAACGLLACAVLGWRRPHPEARLERRAVLVPLAVNALVTGPVVLMLVVDRLRRPASVHSLLPAGSPHLLEATLRAGPVFLLAAWGAWVAWRRGDRMGRLLASQGVAALLLWLAYAALSPLGLVEQPDEIAYWLRVLSGALAGVGAWELLGRAAARWPLLSGDPARRAAAGALLALPLTVPAWWDPPRMDRYFNGSLAPLPAGYREVGEYLLRATPSRAVMATDLNFAPWIAALSGRRSMVSGWLYPPPDYPQRLQDLELLVRGQDPAAVRARAAAWGVTHLVLTPELLGYYGLTRDAVEPRPYLRLVHESRDATGWFAAVFEVAR